MGTIYYINIRKTEVTGETYSTIAINMPSGTLIGGNGSSGTSSSGDTVIVSSSSSPNIDDDWIYISAPESLVGQLQILYDESGAFRDLLIAGQSLFHITDFDVVKCMRTKNIYDFIPATRRFYGPAHVVSKCGNIYGISFLFDGDVCYIAEVKDTYFYNNPDDDFYDYTSHAPYPWIFRAILGSSNKKVNWMSDCLLGSADYYNMEITHYLSSYDALNTSQANWASYNHWTILTPILLDAGSFLVFLFFPITFIYNSTWYPAIGIAKLNKDDLSVIDNRVVRLPSSYIDSDVYEHFEWGAAFFAKIYEDIGWLHGRFYFVFSDSTDEGYVYTSSVDEVYWRLSDLYYTSRSGLQDGFSFSEISAGVSSTAEFVRNGKKSFTVLVPNVKWLSVEPPETQDT